MFWKVVDRAVQLTYLLLAIILLAIVVKSDTSYDNLKTFSNKLDLYIEESSRVRDNNLQYLEGRINKNQAQSDSYQNGVTTRLDVLEERVKRLEKDNKEKNSNVNINSNTINN